MLMEVVGLIWRLRGGGGRFDLDGGGYDDMAYIRLDVSSD
jgi:hypothetical protein